MSGNRPFGDFLRSRRTRLEPDKNVDRLRRRTPGLKREEVAQRAGISAEWYVKLEQGRAVSPSAETVDALGRALRLNPVEVAHLRSLAAAAGRQPFQREHVPDTLHRLVRSLPEPAYLTGQRWDILAWNDAAAALFGDFGRLVPAERNNLHWMLTDPAARRLFGRTWAEEARRMVSLFRVAHDLWPSDPAFVALVDQVHAKCPEFEAWWSEHGVSAPVSGTKHLHHPALGIVRYEYASFQANDDPALKLALYTLGGNRSNGPMVDTAAFYSTRSSLGRGGRKRTHSFEGPEAQSGRFPPLACRQLSTVSRLQAQGWGRAFPTCTRSDTSRHISSHGTSRAVMGVLAVLAR